MKMIDPPSGWLYGFPKPIPDDVKDVKEWLIQQQMILENIFIVDIGINLKTNDNPYIKCQFKPYN